MQEREAGEDRPGERKVRRCRVARVWLSEKCSRRDEKKLEGPRTAWGTEARLAQMPTLASIKVGLDHDSRPLRWRWRSLAARFSYSPHLTQRSAAADDVHLRGPLAHDLYPPLLQLLSEKAVPVRCCAAGAGAGDPRFGSVRCARANSSSTPSLLARARSILHRRRALL